jgi:hypothetical protein
VISYDPDEQQDHWDFVEAKSPEKAEEIVLKAREDHIRDVSAVLTADELRILANKLEASIDAAPSAKKLRKYLGL